MNTPTTRVPASFFFAGQFQHLLLLAGLVPGAVYLASPALGDGQWLGLSDTAWFYAILGVVIIHQVVVALVFRAQLCFSLLTRLFGEHDLLIWGIVFFPLLLLRPLLSLALGFADAGSLVPARGLQIGIGLVLLIPSLYTLWSVQKYFGFTRALGADHFRQRYREMPLVKKGAFRFNSNAMYTFAFLLFWAIGLLTGSRAALATALFQHAYIWVHMYCTEEPDMRVIYQDSGTQQ